MESIVIQFDANTQELTKAIDILEKMGLVAKKDADAFRSLNTASSNFASGQNTVQKELTETEKLLSQIALQGQKTNAILENTGKKSSFGNLKKDISGLDSAIGKIGGAIAGAFAVQQVVAFGQEAIKLSAQFNSIRTALNFIQGGAEQGGQAFEFLTELSNKLGLELVSTAQAFKLFSASAQLGGFTAEATKDIFESVAGATTALGLSADDTNGVFLALSQIISKGTVQAEELRGQIGERLPGAFNLAAKSMGVTTQELGKLLQSGQVLAKDFLPKFADELKNTFAGGLEAASRGTQANLNRITNLYTQFKVNIGNILNTGINAIFEQLGESQDELIKKSADLIRVNREQATSSQALLKEYDSLTQKGIIPTAEQKNRLKVITLQLRDALGESVVSINKETGALEINREAVIAAIKQKLLLANQEAGSLAVKINNAKEDAKFNKTQAADLADQLETRKKILESFKLTAEQADKYNITLIEGGAKANVLEKQLGKDRLKAIDDYEKTLTLLNKTNGVIANRENLVVKLTESLSELGFSAKDVETLFGEATKKPEEEIKKTINSIDALEKKLAQLKADRDKVDTNKPALPTAKDPFEQLSGTAQLASLNKQIKDTEALIKRLRGEVDKDAISSLKKRLSEEEKLRKELVEKEFKADEENLERDLAMRINAINDAEAEGNISHEKAVLYRAQLDYNANAQRIRNYNDYNREIGDLELKQADNFQAIEKAKTAVFVAEQKKRKEEFENRKQETEKFFSEVNDAINTISNPVSRNIVFSLSTIKQLEIDKRSLIDISSDFVKEYERLLHAKEVLDGEALNRQKVIVNIEKKQSQDKQNIERSIIQTQEENKNKIIEIDNQLIVAKKNLNNIQKVEDAQYQKSQAESSIENGKSVINLIKTYLKAKGLQADQVKKYNDTIAETEKNMLESQKKITNAERIIATTEVGATRKDVEEIISALEKKKEEYKTTTESKITELEKQKKATEESGQKELSTLNQIGDANKKASLDIKKELADRKQDYEDYQKDIAKLDEEIDKNRRRFISATNQKRTGKSDAAQQLEDIQKEYDELKKKLDIIRAINRLPIPVKVDTTDAESKIELLNQLLAALKETVEIEVSVKRLERADRIVSETQNFLGAIGNAYDAYYDAQSQRIEEHTQKVLDSLDEQADANEELHSKNRRGDRLYEAEKKRLENERKTAEEKAAKEQRKIAHDTAIFNRNIAIAQTIMNTSMGITKAIADYPWPYSLIVAALVGAEGTAQTIAAANTYIPSYAKGVEKLEGPGTETSDDIPANLSKGERVVTASVNKKFFPILSAIHHERFDPESLNALTKFSPETIRQLAKTDPELIKQIAHLKPVFIEHVRDKSLTTLESMTMVPMKFKNELVSVLRTNETHTKHVSTSEKVTGSNFNEYDMARALDKGTVIKNTKELGKEIGKEIASNLNTNSNRRKI